MQGLVKMALEPEWEAKFEPNSYGFRPGRSCQDAMEAIFNTIKAKPKYVLDADISKCFDCINHNKLLEKLNTYPTLRRQIRAWLKAGVMDGLELKPTSRGTTQGGTISPLLANIALHGMENKIKELAESFYIKDSRGYKLAKCHLRKTVSLIRYADDFVILHQDINCLEQCIEVITQWLNDMGLELKPSKTRITHTLNHYKKEKPGFNFLGFNIRQFKVGKYTSGKNRKGEPLGFKTIISPSKEAWKEHYRRLAKVIDQSKGKTQKELILRINPIIRGWCNYYATVSTNKVFKILGKLTFWKLWKWGVNRHHNKGKKWIKTKYFRVIGEKNWVFATYEGDNLTRLHSHTDTKGIKHVKVKGNASPYDGNLIYWSSRMGKHPEMPKRKALLLKRQKGKCAHCKLTFREQDVLEIDHIIPTAAGGKDEYKNMQLMHLHCHDEKSRLDLDTINRYKKDNVMKEIHKWFNKLDWEWIDDIPTLI